MNFNRSKSQKQRIEKQVLEQDAKLQNLKVYSQTQILKALKKLTIQQLFIKCAHCLNPISQRFCKIIPSSAVELLVISFIMTTISHIMFAHLICSNKEYWNKQGHNYNAKPRHTDHGINIQYY